MTVRALIGLLLALLTAVPGATARDILVSNTDGNDSWTGRRVEATADGNGPVQTITKALRLAGPGDRIVLAKTPQPYRESFTLSGSQHSGISTQPFVINGSGATLDGSAAVPPDSWEHYRGAVFRFRPPVLGDQQLFLDNRPAQHVTASFMATEPPKLNPREWNDFDGSIYFCVEKNRLPRDYPLSYAQYQTGITLYHVEHVAILDLVVQGFRLDGINSFNSARYIYLAGLTCRGNGHSGISVGGSSTVTIEGCLVGDNGRAQLLTLPLSETSLSSSDLLPKTAPAWVDQGGRFFLRGKQLEGGLEKITAQP